MNGEVFSRNDTVPRPLLPASAVLRSSIPSPFTSARVA
jgi:hypothetical protein